MEGVAGEAEVCIGAQGWGQERCGSTPNANLQGKHADPWVQGGYDYIYIEYA
jgi:hypothetical protein